MNSPFIIRPARSSEKSRLLTLFEELDELHRRALPHIFRKPPDAAGRERSIPDGWMDGPDSIVLVADSGRDGLLGLAIFLEKTRGATIVSRERRFAELDHLIVAGKARRRGIGRSLVNAGRDWARSRNLHGLEVAFWSFNEEARAFYRHEGFSPLVERLSLKL